jgi:hypothetical protein
MKSIFFILTLMFAVAAHALERMPASLFLVANEGQWEEPFAFKAAVGNAVYYVTSTGMTVDYRQYERSQRARDPMDRFDPRHEQEPVNVRGHVLKMDFVNANAHPEIVGEDKLASYSNYFIGRDSCKWRSFVGHYQTVRMKNVWPGIDVVQKVQPDGIETIYRVQAGADAAQIMVQYEGLEAPLTTDGQGNLLLQTSLGIIKEKAPFAYQIVNHRQVEVPVRYQVLTNDRYSLSFEAFDIGQELVIDPLLYGTFWGGGREDVTLSIKKDDFGSIILAGRTGSYDFPVTLGAYQTQLMTYDGFVTKLTPVADSIVFSTYLGAADGTASIFAAGLNTQGAIYVVGGTDCPGWPVTADAFDSQFGGMQDGFLVRLHQDGSALEFSSYLGGSAVDIIWGMTVGSDRLVYMCGETSSNDFPIAGNAPYPSHETSKDGFLSVFNPTTSNLTYSTYIPGNDFDQPQGLKVASPGRVWVWGATASSDFRVTVNAVQEHNGSGTSGVYNGFFCLFNLVMNILEYSSYLGGSVSDGITDMDILDSNLIILAGGSASPDFPITHGAYDSVPSARDGFVTILLLPDSIVHSTFLGGDDSRDYVWGVHADRNCIKVIGQTYSYDFPVTHDAYDTLFNGTGLPSHDLSDIFVSRFNFDLSRLEYSTFLGGSGSDDLYAVYFENSDTMCIGGETGSSDLPVTPNAVQHDYHDWGDGFLLRFAVPESTSTVTPRESPLPADLSLSVYPNPFNPATTIFFTLPKSSPVRFDVFDLLGRTVYQTDLGRLNAGTHQQLFNLPGLASGTYVVRLKAGGKEMSRKMVVIR